MVIAIFGGAFDPIHRDHLRMAQAAIDFRYCEQVWMLPSPDRWDKHPRTSASLRMQMIQSALAHQPSKQILPCDLELQMGTYRGSYVLLDTLRSMYPQHEFRLLVGADSVPAIPQWRDTTTYDGTNPNGVQLLQEFSLIVFPRHEYAQPFSQQFAASGYKELFAFTDSQGQLLVEPGIEASHELRMRLWTDPAAQNELPTGVWEFIADKRLYS